MFKKIKSAVKQIEGAAHYTPVVMCNSLNKMLGAEIYFKCENFQRVGAFKFRGAFNSISKLSDQQKKAGVIAYSSGNHAQAIACVGQMMGIDITIVMPNNAPIIKKLATQGYGATIIEFDPATQIRESVAEQILNDAINNNAPLTLIPPFDHEDVIAGQGTVAVEFLNECPDLNMLLAPCGGGGLLSGTAVAAKHINSACQVIGIEPELADDATLSFRAGILHSNPNPPTIADGTRSTSLGELTFPLIQKYVDDMQTVSEEAIKEAVRFLFYRMKLVVEPSGALGLAALLDGVIKPKPKAKIGVILSGGNIDGQTMADILTN